MFYCYFFYWFFFFVKKINKYDTNNKTCHPHWKTEVVVVFKRECKPWMLLTQPRATQKPNKQKVERRKKKNGLKKSVLFSVSVFVPWYNQFPLRKQQTLRIPALCLVVQLYVCVCACEREVYRLVIIHLGADWAKIGRGVLLAARIPPDKQPAMAGFQRSLFPRYYQKNSHYVGHAFVCAAKNGQTVRHTFSTPHSMDE